MHTWVDVFGLDCGKKTKYLYRFDERSPNEIKKAGGFKSWGDDMDLLKHADGTNIYDRRTSGYISATRYRHIAEKTFPDGTSGYVYKIKDTGNSIDVNKVLGAKSPFPYEKETVIPRSVSLENIVDSWSINI